MKRFIRELRRREVFGSAGLYIGIGWILIEVGGVVLPAFDAPEWVFRGLIIVVFAGFPLMLVLAWFFDIHRGGIRAQGDATDTMVAQLGERKTDFLVIGVLAVALSISLYFNLSEQPERTESSGIEAKTLLVTRFEGLDNDPLLADVVAWALSTGLESAPSISIYTPVGALDTQSGRATAANEGVAWVITGSAEEMGEGYRLTVTGIDTATDEAQFSVSETLREHGLLEGVADLAAKVQRRLDVDPAARAEVSARPPFDAVRAYVQGRAAMTAGDFDSAATLFSDAIEQSPDFGDAYAQLTFTEAARGRLDAAKTNWTHALSHAGTVSDRQRLRNLARYYTEVESDTTAAVAAYKDLLEKYPVDTKARGDYAKLAFTMLDFSTATEQTERALETYPNSIQHWAELALYAMYAGDWDRVIEASEQATTDGVITQAALLTSAATEMAKGNTEEARDIFANIGSRTEDDLSSFATLALADIDLFLGRSEDVRGILQSAIETGIADNKLATAAAEYILLAEASAEQGQLSEAVAAAENATQLSGSNAVMVSAALIFIRSRNVDRAQVVANALVDAQSTVAQAYGRMLQALLLQTREQPTDAVFALREAADTADLWLIRYELGKAYVAAGYFTEALDELTVATNRNGEAMALFQDGLPTFRYLAELPYWVGRAQEGLNISEAARTSYEAFIERRPDDNALGRDARERIATLD